MEAFEIMAGDKDHITKNDLQMNGLNAEQISFITQQMPSKGEDGYDYHSWLANKFKRTAA